MMIVVGAVLFPAISVRSSGSDRIPTGCHPSATKAALCACHRRRVLVQPARRHDRPTNRIPTVTNKQVPSHRLKSQTSVTARPVHRCQHNPSRRPCRPPATQAARRCRRRANRRSKCWRRQEMTHTSTTVRGCLDSVLCPAEADHCS